MPQCSAQYLSLRSFHFNYAICLDLTTLTSLLRFNTHWDNFYLIPKTPPPHYTDQESTKCLAAPHTVMPCTLVRQARNSPLEFMNTLGSSTSSTTILALTQIILNPIFLDTFASNNTLLILSRVLRCYIFVRRAVF